MKRWRRVALLSMLAVAGLLLGLGLGVGAVAETTTLTETKVLTKTTTTVVVREVVKRRTVRSTVTESVTVTEPPTADGLYVDEGQFSGVIAVHGPQWRSGSLGVEVIGQVEYLGGLECDPIPFLELSGTLFDDSGTIVATSATNETGVGSGSRYPFTMFFDRNVDRGRVELLVAGATC